MNFKDRIILAPLILGTYVVLALFVDQIGGGGLFWTIIGALLAARFFFFLMHVFISFLIWQFYRRKEFTDWFLTFLKGHEFPKVRLESEYIISYLSRIRDDHKAPTQLRLDAQYLNMTISEIGGFMDRYLNERAAQKALNTYT